MSSAHKERIDQIKKEIHAVIGKDVSEIFLRRVDAIIEDGAAGKLTAAMVCEKVQKLVSLFIDEGKAREISSRCATIVMRESVLENK